MTQANPFREWKDADLKAFIKERSGEAPDTLAASYNITSITDTGTGRLTITIATNFSSLDHTALAEMANTIAAQTERTA